MVEWQDLPALIALAREGRAMTFRLMTFAVAHMNKLSRSKVASQASKISESLYFNERDTEDCDS